MLKKEIMYILTQYHIIIYSTNQQSVLFINFAYFYIFLKFYIKMYMFILYLFNILILFLGLVYEYTIE